MRHLFSVFALVLVLSITATPLLAQSSIDGVWKIIEFWGTHSEVGEWRFENVQPSLWLFMDGYYSATYVLGNQERPLAPENPEEMSGDDWKSMAERFVANAGTYEITASTVTLYPIVAKLPNFMDGDDIDPWEYRFEGDVLYVTQPRKWGTVHHRLQRLE